MELEEETSGIDTMDDNDTTDDNPEASYEEWLIKAQGLSIAGYHPQKADPKVQPNPKSVRAQL